ncbi:hypothetical protein D9M71_595390 [compost metagenome]
MVEPITLGLPISCRLRCSLAARRRTFSPPGSVPSYLRPLLTHSCMASQSLCRPARISSSLRQTFSLAIINCDTLRSFCLHRRSSSAALLKSYGSTVWSASSTPLAAWAASTTKPPPTE